MAEDDNKTVTVEEYNKLKGDFDAQTKQFNEQKAKLDKLEKIFEERQTKTLDKEGILKILGIEKAPDKPIGEVLGEKFNTLNGLVEQLQKDIKAKDEKLALNEKKAKILEAAKAYNFIDVNDVLNVFDFNNEDIDGQLKAIAENKKHWIKPKENLGGPFNGGSGNPADLNEQLREAIKNKNVDLQIALKRQIYEQSK